MNKSKKLISIFLLIALLITGCSGKTETATTEATTAVAAESTEATTEADPLAAYTKENPISITFWNFPNFTGDTEFGKGDYDLALIKAFEEKHPNVKVEYQAIEFTDGPAKLETAIQSRTNPDVVYDAPGRVIDWASKGYLIPLDDMVDKSTLLQAAVTASSYEDSLYLYPQGVAPFMMGFNKGLLEEMGLVDMLPLDRENRAWSVEEYEALLTAIHEKNAEIAPAIMYAKSQGGDQGPRAFVSNLYGSWITNDEITEYTINDENGVKAMEWIKQAYDKGLLGQGIALDAGASIEAFRSGLAASTILYSPGLYRPDMIAKKFTPVLVPYPNNTGTPELEYLVAGPCIFENGDADKAAASKLFVDFMINDADWGKRTLLSTGNFSAKNGETGLYDDAELLFAEKMSMYFGPYYNTIPGFAQMRTAWFPMVQGVLNGDQTPKESLDAFVEFANQSIEDAK